MRPRSFRARPADDDEFLPVQPFGLAPQAAVSRYITRLDRLRDNALKTEFPGVLEDELAVASLMAVELNARLACDQGLKKRLALDKRQARDVPAVKMQEIEGVIDEPHLALAVGRCLGVGEARQSRFTNATEFTVDVGGLHV